MAIEGRPLVIVLAVALQIQITLFVFSSDVRVALSDLVLPLLVCVFGYRLMRSQSGIVWRISGMTWWLLAITAGFCIALVTGYWTLGLWSSWAVVNKWCGWFALAAYFVVGGAIVRLGGAAERQTFLKAFLLTAAIVAGLNILALPWLLPAYTLPVGIEFKRATGLMQNPNAFGFLLAVCVLLAFATVRPRTLYLYVVPLLAALWFSSSRGATLALAVGIGVLHVLRPESWRIVLRSLALAVLVIVVATTAMFAANIVSWNRVLDGRTTVGFLSVDRYDPNATTIREREAQNEQAAELFLEAPFLGHGLGYFVDRTGRTLHNSLLWLVLEMGLIGTLPMVGFLFAAVGALYFSRDDPFALGMVAVATAFMVMSVTGEFLYQRHLWVLLGMALAADPRALDTS